MRIRRLLVWTLLGVAVPALAPSLSAHGDLHKRIARLTKQIGRTPQKAALYLKRGELHRLHRDWLAARADFTEIRRLRPATKELDFLEGRLEYQAGQPAIALRFLDSQLRRQPGHLDSLLFRARALTAMGRVGSALRDYDALLQRDGVANPDHFLERARVQVRAKVATRRILAGLDLGVTRLGPIVSLQLFALDLQYADADWAGALRRVDATMEQAPLRSPWLLRRGEILERMGREREARDGYVAGLKELLRAPRLNPLQEELRGRLQRALESVSSTDPETETPRNRDR